MEASTLPASVGLARARHGLGVPLLRLRSDDQLVSLFRAGNEDAFRVIHDRYRTRMLAYARQMLASSPADAEDAVQEVFVRAYAGLRANRRDLALRAWLYRIAHNRCVDDLRRPYPVAVEAVEELGEATGADPHARVEQREALRRLIADVQRLPEQQRSALLMRELGGMTYADLAGALGTSVPAVKSLLVRARVGLVKAGEARDTACVVIREDLIGAHDRGVRASGRTRRHLRDCSECRRFRTEVQGTSRRLGLLLPALGPLAAIAKIVGIGGGGAAAGTGTGAAAGSTAATTVTGAAAVGGAAAAGGAAATGGAVATIGAGTGAGAVASAGAAVGGHVATILAATAIAAGGVVGIQHAVASSHRPARVPHATAMAALPAVAPAPAPASRAGGTTTAAASGPVPDRVAGDDRAAGATTRPAATRSSGLGVVEGTIAGEQSTIATGTTGAGTSTTATTGTSGTTGTGPVTGTTATTASGTATTASGTATTVTSGTTGTTGTATGTITTPGATATDPATTVSTGTVTSAGAGPTTVASAAPTTGSTSAAGSGAGAPTSTSTTVGDAGGGGLQATVNPTTAATGLGRADRRLHQRWLRHRRRGVPAASATVR